jgi:uncharacterized protein (TIGR02266 family)
MGHSPTPQLLLTFKDRQAFLARYHETRKVAGLFVAGHVELEVGSVVELELAFADDRMVFRGRGVVRDRFIEDGHPHAPGLWVEFPPSEEKTRHLVVEYARGRDRQTVKRRPRRFKVRIQVAYATEAEFKQAHTEDLSRGGAFIETDELFDSGTLLALRIEPGDGHPAISTTAEVAWRQEAPVRGFGVRFTTGDLDKMEQIAELVDAMARQSTIDGK